MNRRWPVNRESRTGNPAGSADAGTQRHVGGECCELRSWLADRPYRLPVETRGRPGAGSVPRGRRLDAKNGTRRAVMDSTPFPAPPARHGHQNQFTESCRRRVSTPFQQRYADIYIFLIYLNWDLKWKFAWANGYPFLKYCYRS